MIISKPDPLPQAVLDATNRWISTQRSRLFCMVSPNSIDRGLVDEIYERRKDFENIEKLDILLDSSGGDIEAAYQLITFLRAKCKQVRIFVVDWAKSAATLLALGADEIWMGETAELGPLDAQISDPRDPHNSISALDEFRSIEYLRTHGFEIFDQFSRVLRRTTRFKLSEIISHSIEYATTLVAPLYSQVDPLYFGGAHRALDLSIQYGQRVMSRYAYKSWSRARIKELLEKLTFEYPSHSFVLDYTEAKELDLNVHLLTGDMEDCACTIYSGVRECVGFLDEAMIPGVSPAEIKKEEGTENNGLGT